MNEQYSITQIKKYQREFGKKYGASVAELQAIAMMESSNDPYIGVHPDGVSHGLMGITKGVEKEFQTYESRHKDKGIVKDNIELGAWYWGTRIPQMLKYYGVKNTLRNRTIAYNAGIAYTMKQDQLPARTMAYITHMQESKKKRLFPLLLSGLASVILFWNG